MLRIFIGYGGPKAEEVAKKLENFLLTEMRMDVFLGSPKSASLPANAHDYLARINQQLIWRDYAVFVCHEGTDKSDAMIEELNLLFSKNMESKIFILSANDTCIPQQFLSKLWRPLHFNTRKPEDSFYRLATEIYRSEYEKNKPSIIVKENEEIPLQ